MYQDYKIIALCISKVHTKINLSLVASLNRKLVPLGYRILIFHTSTDLYRGTLNDTAEKTIFEIIPYDIVDAVVIHSESFYDKWMIQSVVNTCRFNHIPVISVGTKHEGCYNIVFEYDIGFRAVVEHLINDHHLDDIVMIGGFKGSDFSENRLQIFKDVMNDHKLPCGDDRIYYGDLWEVPTRAVAEQILTAEHLPQAIVCVNDYTAITTIEVCKKHNIRIPEDVIVTGFDGMDEATYCTPSITTSGCDADRVADMIVTVICNAEKNTTSSALQKVPFTLKTGASCGCGENARYEDIGNLLKSADDRFNGYIDFGLHLYELGEKLITCQTTEEQMTYLKNLRISNCALIMNKDFMDETISPFESKRKPTYDSELMVIYQDGISAENRRATVSIRDLVPGLDEMFDKGYPVLFNALSYLGNPMGYFVYYCDPILNNHCHIVQYVTMLNQAFGGSHNVSYLNHLAQSMEDLSDHDFLTGLLNRKGFNKALSDFLGRMDKSRTILIASIDLDGLKFINDTYGHASGDQAIRLAAQAIDKIPLPDKITARFGGDEFVLVTALTEEMDMQAINNSLDINLDVLNDLNTAPFDVTTSFGGVLASPKDFDFESLFKQADEKMYIIKKNKPHSRH